MGLFVGDLDGMLYTGGAMNPARALEPSVADTDFPATTIFTGERDPSSY